MILAIGIPTNYTFAMFCISFIMLLTTFFIYFHMLFATFFLLLYFTRQKRETSFASLSTFTLFLRNPFFTVHSSHLSQSALSSDDSLSELLPHHSGPGILSSVRSSKPSYRNLHRILRSSHRIRRQGYHLPE